MSTELDKVTRAAKVLQDVRTDEAEALRMRNEAIEAALDAGIGQTAIAAAAGTSQAVVSRIEKARASEGVAR